MPSIVVKSEIFGEMYGTEAMRDIFSDRALLGRYLGRRGGSRPRASRPGHHSRGRR